MKKINLQLFAKLNTDESIVDYLKSQGKDSSYSARKKLAESLGITNYTGDGTQNTQMLNALKNGGGTQKKETPKASGGGSNGDKGGGSKAKAINGVDSTTQKAMTSTFTASDNVTNAQNDASKYLGNLQSIPSFSASSSYQQAMEYTNSLLEQLSTGKTSYSDQVKEMMDKIQNREDFEYDVDKDMLFQQYLGSAMNTGKQAMQNTIGQASALTGGYGSTYATSAGNQMYNAYIQDAYNNLPEYYQMALEAYQMEGDEMYKQLAMLNDADEKEYSRLYNSWQANFSNANAIYEKDLNEWSANLDQAYKTYDATQGYAQQMYQNEYSKWADEVSNAYKYASMLNADYWNQKDEDYRYASLKQNQEQFDAEMAYKQSQKSNSGTVKTVKDTNGKDVEVDVDNIPKAITTNASKFDNNGELGQYLDQQESLGIITEAEADYLYATNMKPEEVPLNERDWTLTDDGGTNWLGGIDRNGAVVDQYDNPYTMIDLFNELKKTMSAEDARKYILELQKNVGITNK